MTAFLASVVSPDETDIVLAGGADIVDLKDPASGALGALPPALIAAAVARVAGRRPVSATAGDLPMVPEVVDAAVERIAASGVDFVKVGLFPDGDVPGCLDALAAWASRGTRLVAVLFADLDPDFGLIEALAARGFAGVMLDTAGKSGGCLLHHQHTAALGDFVGRARASGLFTGLAGSLGLADVPAMIDIGPDYLGFRGALTGGGRTAPLDAGAVRAVRLAIPADAYAASAANIASAAAGAQRAAISRTGSGPAIRSAKST